jgi:putative hydrolase of the HAD superfamily
VIQAILFDIDGTMTNINTVDFMRNYLGILAPRFAHLISPERFTKQLIKSMQVMQSEPKAGQTNMQTFYEDFCRAIGQPFQVLKPIFEEFYASDFPTLRCLIQPYAQGVKVIEYSIQQGFLTAIASKPVMPIIAVRKQIRWAGFTPEHFKVIPALDNFHYCKPHLGFFSELAESLGFEPKECLLVSENQEDTVCRELGMKHFFVGTLDEMITDYSGNLEDLLSLIGQGIL